MMPQLREPFGTSIFERGWGGNTEKGGEGGKKEKERKRSEREGKKGRLIRREGQKET